MPQATEYQGAMGVDVQLNAQFIVQQELWELKGFAEPVRADEDEIDFEVEEAVFEKFVAGSEVPESETPMAGEISCERLASGPSGIGCDLSFLGDDGREIRASVGMSR